MTAPRVDWRPHPIVLRTAAYAGCIIVVALALFLVFEVLGRLGIVFFPVVTAVFLTRVLSVPNSWLLRRGWRPAPAAGSTLAGFIAILVLAGFLIAPPMVSEFSTLGDTLKDGTTEIEDWLVEDSSFDVDRKDIQDFKDDVEERGRETLENSTDTIARGARLVIEIVVGFVLALVLTFFGLKDGRRFHDWLIGLAPRDHRIVTEKVGRSAWATLGGYIRGAALLGGLEGAIIGAAMALVGAHLVVPVALLTFAAAFVPLVGATVAGVIAVLVTLASAGLTPALIVAVVAILVQQFDNELLAPWIYGKALDLHPAVILLSIAAGTALFGIAGALLAVPVAGIVINGVAAVKAHRAGLADEIAEAAVAKVNRAEADAAAALEAEVAASTADADPDGPAPAPA